MNCGWEFIHCWWLPLKGYVSNLVNHKEKTYNGSVAFNFNLFGYAKNMQDLGFVPYSPQKTRSCGTYLFWQLFLLSGKREILDALKGKLHHHKHHLQIEILCRSLGFYPPQVLGHYLWQHYAQLEGSRHLLAWALFVLVLFEGHLAILFMLNSFSFPQVVAVFFGFPLLLHVIIHSYCKDFD